MVSQINASSSNAEKITLFRSLFVGREDVFARRYENEKKGTSGYSPCCRNQWGAGCVLKQHKKCSECAARQHVPVSDEVVRWHLRGKDADMKPFAMGLYPMATDETVRLSVIVVMLDPSSSLAGVEFYRSTRREDALLQKNGYCVLRLLVDDVCTDLDAALDAIQGCCNLK